MTNDNGWQANINLRVVSPSVTRTVCASEFCGLLETREISQLSRVYLEGRQDVWQHADDVYRMLRNRKIDAVAFARAFSGEPAPTPVQRPSSASTSPNPTNQDPSQARDKDPRIDPTRGAPVEPTPQMWPDLEDSLDDVDDNVEDAADDEAEFLDMLELFVRLWASQVQQGKSPGDVIDPLFFADTDEFLGPDHEVYRSPFVLCDFYAFLKRGTRLDEEEREWLVERARALGVDVDRFSVGKSRSTDAASAKSGCYPAIEIDHDELRKMLEQRSCSVSMPPSLCRQLSMSDVMPTEFKKLSALGGFIYIAALLMSLYVCWQYFPWWSFLLIGPVLLGVFLTVRTLGIGLSAQEYCLMAAYKHPVFWELLQQTHAVKVYCHAPGNGLPHVPHRFKR